MNCPVRSERNFAYFTFNNLPLFLFIMLIMMGCSGKAQEKEREGSTSTQKGGKMLDKGRSALVLVPLPNSPASMKGQSSITL